MKFKHYKGGIYNHVGTALHTETQEHLTVYKNGEGELYARPLDMFYETIEVDGKPTERFEIMLTESHATDSALNSLLNIYANTVAAINSHIEKANYDKDSIWQAAEARAEEYALIDITIKQLISGVRVLDRENKLGTFINAKYDIDANHVILSTVKERIPVSTCTLQEALAKVSQAKWVIA